MSLRGVVDVLVHFESFRNVDLYHQGIYYLKSSLYHRKETKVSCSFTNNLIFFKYYYGKPMTIYNSKFLGQQSS